jgi:hypothetical protein
VAVAQADARRQDAVTAAAAAAQALTKSTPRIDDSGNVEPLRKVRRNGWGFGELRRLSQSSRRNSNRLASP